MVNCFRMSRVSLLVYVCALMLAITIPATVMSAPQLTFQAETPTVTAGIITNQDGSKQDIHLDGLLDEPAWQRAGVITDLVQQDPLPGQPTPFTTEVRILVDSSAIYIGFISHDPEPAAIAIHSMQRDGDMAGDDSVAVILDPTSAGRRGYYFKVNAAGARFDGLVSGPQDLSADWDGIWDAATQLTATGWTAEIRIPAQTLRFHWGQDHWSFNVQRYIARIQTNLRWSGISLDASFIDLQRAGQLSGIGGLRQGKGLSISPYGLASAEKNYANATQSSNVEVGGNLTWNFSGDLSGYLTVNPDFAETEVDTLRANLTRFPLFFPEKRSFFLEGSNIFNFGPGTDNDFIPFFSRRIGLFNGEKIALPGGVKLLGRIGSWQLAGLAVAAEETDVTGKTTLYSARVTYDVNENLTIGAIGTHGDPEGIRDNTLGGVDVLWRTSRFRGNKNFAIGGWAAASYGDIPSDRDTRQNTGQNMGWGFIVDFPNDLWGITLKVKDFGSNLDPALGFLPRPGTRWYSGGIVYQPRPKSGTFAWVRQFFFEVYPRYIEDANGRAESWRIFTAPLNVNTQSGDQFEVNLMPSFERLDEPFEIADGVRIPVGSYNYIRYGAQVESSSHRAWRIGSRVWFGNFFTGRLTQMKAFASYATPAGHLRLKIGWEHSIGQLPEGDFTLDVGRVNIVYAFTPDLILSSNIQYSSESHAVGANTRFRWTIKPGNDLFIVWNRDWQRLFGDGDLLDLQTTGDQLVAKLRWTFRM